MVNLIFGGCDCVGKSSIIKELIKLEPKYEVIKRNAPKDKERARLQYHLDVDYLNSHDNKILDRSMFCECIYSPLLRGYYPEYMRELEKKVNDNNFLILVTARLDIVQKRFDGVFIKAEQIPTILENYQKEFMVANYNNKMLIDTSDITPLEGANKILKYFIFGKCKWQASKADKNVVNL
jgi:hypothetical protein